ncbi:MAG: MmcQ/YjbR family DNA-binding protein [Clostridiales bacterium]|nr:MmcQ/YjbR family DNA-binding protein [Clostridiales bacterium]
MNRRQLTDLCLTLPDAFEDYPFEDENWTVVRHRSNRKLFAMVYERDGKLYLNLKCDPMQADLLRSSFAGITPGYHMNKTHWNTVDPNSDVPLSEIQRMIRLSYDLTMPKVQRKHT